MRAVSEVGPLMRSLVAAGTAAASSHNTQPWKFRLEDKHVRILPDFTRRCPQVDPDDHHLYASLGCAAENIVVAAQARGLSANLAVHGTTSGHVVDIDLVPGGVGPFPLAGAIDRRQCTRAAYDGRPVPIEQLRKLEAVGTDGVSILLFTDAASLESVAEFVARGNDAQIGDPRWRDELVSWLRFNEREARRKGDGLWSKATGNPDVPRFLGRLIMKVALTPKSQNKKDVPWIRSSAGVAVFVSEQDDPEHWIEAGRCYERFALETTARGIRNAFINQPVEVAELRGQFTSWAGIGSRRPDLVVRFGYGPVMPESKRRPVGEVIVANG